MFTRTRAFFKGVRGKMGKRAAARNQRQNRPLSPVYEEENFTTSLQEEDWQDPLEEESYVDGCEECCEKMWCDQSFTCEKCLEEESDEMGRYVGCCLGCEHGCEGCYEIWFYEEGCACEDCLADQEEVSGGSDPGFQTADEDSLDGSEVEYVRPGTPWAGFRHAVEDSLEGSETEYVQPETTWFDFRNAGRIQAQLWGQLFEVECCGRESCNEIEWCTEICEERCEECEWSMVNDPRFRNVVEERLMGHSCPGSPWDSFRHTVEDSREIVEDDQNAPEDGQTEYIRPGTPWVGY